MSVHKNKSNNTWYVKYNNKTKRGFKTKKEAINYNNQLLLNKDDNSNLIGFYELLDSYIQYTYNNSFYSTYIKKKNIINNIIKPNFKNKLINCIEPLDCENFRNKLNSLSYSTSYKNNILCIFKNIFSYATYFYHLNSDPSSRLKSFTKTHIEKMEDRYKENNVWSYDEFNRFIEYVDRLSYKTLFIILFYTGVRLGEALALNWNDIDLDNRVIHINKSLTRKTDKGNYEIKETKTASSIRDIKITKGLTDYLINYKSFEQNVSGFNYDWFVMGRCEPLPQTTIDRVKDNAIKKANVKRIRIHDFRHSHATILISEGCNIVAVSKRLGHSDIEMTLKVYTHLLPRNEDEIIDKLEKSSQNLLKIFSNK